MNFNFLATNDFFIFWSILVFLCQASWQKKNDVYISEKSQKRSISSFQITAYPLDLNICYYNYFLMWSVHLCTQIFFLPFIILFTIGCNYSMRVSSRKKIANTLSFATEFELNWIKFTPARISNLRRFWSFVHLWVIQGGGRTNSSRQRCKRPTFVLERRQRRRLIVEEYCKSLKLELQTNLSAPQVIYH